MREYYDARALEYDDWYLGLGRFARLARPRWDGRARPGADDRQPTARSYARRGLRHRIPDAAPTGEITALDQSERMLAFARQRLPTAVCVRGDALELAFEDDCFERVFTAHFYGHLEEPERELFLAEAAGCAGADRGRLGAGRSACAWPSRGGVTATSAQHGSRFTVYKRYFDARGLAVEQGGWRDAAAREPLVRRRVIETQLRGGSRTAYSAR
jgi:SAM-dependent methyltransferase